MPKVAERQMTPSQKIQIGREALRPTEVEGGKLPADLRKRLLELKRQKKISPSWGTTGNEDLLRAAVDAACKSDDWLDHYGKTILHDREVFVSEPYGLRLECLQDIQAFAQLVGLGYRILSNSWHYPGQTIRIAFFVPDPGPRA